MKAMTIVNTHTQTIDGITYTAKTMPATVGLVILPKLIAMVGEPIVKLMTSEKEVRDELVKSPAVLAAVLTSIATSAAKTDGLLVVKDLLAGVECDKVRIGETEVPGSADTHFDTHFAGRYKHLAEVAMWVITCNFVAP